MPDIAATDVTTTLVSQSLDGQGFKENVVDIAFGDGALTYPSGGVPLTIGDFGTPNAVKHLAWVEPDADDGLIYKYDASANTVRIYEGDYAQVGDAPLVELDAASDTPAATVLRAKVNGF